MQPFDPQADVSACERDRFRQRPPTGRLRTHPDRDAKQRGPLYAHDGHIPTTKYHVPSRMLTRRRRTSAPLRLVAERAVAARVCEGPVPPATLSVTARSKPRCVRHTRLHQDRERFTANLVGQERLEDHQFVPFKNNTRLVYSTETAGRCSGCGRPQRECRCSAARTSTPSIPGRIVAKLRMEKKGRAGKVVTLVYGLPPDADLIHDLARELKRACGTGGTSTEDGVELQGDLRDRVRDVLTKRGYVVKG